MARLIDADALVGCVTELYEYDLHHADADDYTDGRASAEHGILEKIRELPTINAIPVKWIETLLREWLKGSASFEACGAIAAMLYKWQKEQEAR